MNDGIDAKCCWLCLGEVLESISWGGSKDATAVAVVIATVLLQYLARFSRRPFCHAWMDSRMSYLGDTLPM